MGNTYIKEEILHQCLCQAYRHNIPDHGHVEWRHFDRSRAQQRQGAVEQ